MIKAMSSDLALLEPLARLTAISSPRRGHYFLQLLDDTDPVLRVAAWRALFELRAITEDLHGKLLADCEYGAVRSRAFDYFESIFEHDLARQAAETAVDNPEDAKLALMRAALTEDSKALLAAEERRYLSTGDIAHMIAATTHAERAGGWRAGLETAVRGFLAGPQSVPLLTSIVRLIDSANSGPLMRELAARLGAARVFAHLSELAAAMADQLEGDSAKSLSRLEGLLNNRAIAGPLAPFLGNVKKARADALHKAGLYREAYAAFVDLNAYDAANATGSDPTEYVKGLEARGALAIPPLPADLRSETILMLGFPRSGTTLLENALGAHPAIETLEEIPSQRAAVSYVERILGKLSARPASDVDIYLGARQRFYREIDLRRHRPEATVIIDKMPIRSGDAKFLAKLFPDRRYIFSVRHPYDVVFSCFRQRFNPNPAMENFRTIESAARVYDYVMRQWFDTHGLDDPSVHYVRYDELVTDFEATTKRVLGFLGLVWSDEITTFAERAEQRAAKTPSYQKVRQGLSIGVQSAWMHYDFAFRGEPAKLLDRWVTHFGYEVSDRPGRKSPT